MKCPNCGKESWPARAHCPFCGASAAATAAAPGHPEVAPAASAEVVAPADWVLLANCPSETAADSLLARLTASGIPACRPEASAAPATLPSGQTAVSFPVMVPSRYRLVGNRYLLSAEADAAAGLEATGTGLDSRPQTGGEDASDAQAMMIKGALWCLGGIAVTVISYQSAIGRGGGAYLIAWGAILFGAFEFLGGLFGVLAQSSRARAADLANDRAPDNISTPTSNEGLPAGPDRRG